MNDVELIFEKYVEMYTESSVFRTGERVEIPVFHGSPKYFGDKFDINHRAPTLGRGAYFSTSESYARRYLSSIPGQTPEEGSHLYKAIITFQNPLVLTDKSLQDTMMNMLRAVPKGYDWGDETAEGMLGDKIREMGHDGIIWTKENGLVEIVAFKQTQIVLTK